MKKLLLLIICLYSLPIFAQKPTGNSKINGIVLDSTAAKPVDFATIALYDKLTNKIVDGATADEKGAFLIEKVAVGNYKITISFIGYADKTIDNVNIEKGKDVKLGVIRLSTNVKLLGEVTVTAQKSLIEEKVDRTIYNAENDITARGGDATDVLRKVPLLTVDLEGNVTLRGNSNIKVLINNKPSSIMASSVADALKQIPADMIKTVEVITSPSARYDAEGSSGIINIVTKKNTLQGVNLNVDGGVGNRSSNLGLNGNYRKGKFGATLGGHGRAMYNKDIISTEQKSTLNGNTILIKQNADAQSRPLFGFYNLGLDYDISANQSLTAGVRYGVRNFSRTQGLNSDLFTNNVFTSNSFRDLKTSDLSNSVDVNLDYLKTFKPQQEWSIATQYSGSNLTNNFDANILNGSKEIISRQKNLNLNLNQEVTFQTDYQTPIGANQIIEFGGKGIFRNVNSDFKYQLASGATADYVNDASRASGVLDYNQNIVGAYTSYTLSTKKKYTIKAGGRYEYTSIDATQAGKDIVIPSYSNFVPSINISKKVKDNLTVKGGYNRRIQRPGLQQLNPNVNAANPQSISVGNPSLRPELTDNIEMGISTNIKKTFLNISVFARQTNNAISQIRRVSDTSASVLITTFENVGKQMAYGSNVFANIAITSKWSVNGGFDFNYTYLEGKAPDATGVSKTISNSGFTLRGHIMSQLTLGKGWGAQGFLFGRGPSVQLQGTQRGTPMYSLGIRKDFNDKKGTIGIAGENFFTNGAKMTTNFVSDQFSQISTTQILNRGVKLTFSYKIGKMGFTQRKTRSVKNDDVKDGGSGGDNSGGGGGAQAPSAAPAQGGGKPQGAQGQGQGGAKPQGTGGKPMPNGQPQNGAAPMKKPTDMPKKEEKKNEN
jgi:outer membrane receptor protein involved in Fe transport